MYIRRISNKTGTVSVQVISKHTGKYKVMRSFGAGRNEQEIVRLEEHARQFIIEQRGFVGELFSNEENDSLEDFLSTITTANNLMLGVFNAEKRLAKAIGIITVFCFESLCHGVALCFKYQANTLIVVEDLKYGGCAAVCRYEK